MNNKLNLEINNFGLINEANIEINKINVIGGINSSGKSTASKLFYCLLKANSSKRKEYLLFKIISNINDYIIENDKSNDNALKYDADYSEILKIYEKYKQKYSNHDNLKNALLIEKIDELIDMVDLDENILASALTRYLLNNESLYDLIGKSYYHCGEEYGTDTFAKIHSNKFEALIHSSRTEVTDDGFAKPPTDYEDLYFDYVTNGIFDEVEDVFYVSPVSLFDIKKFQNENLINEMIFGYEEHIQDLLINLENSSTDSLDKTTQDDLKYVQDNVLRIINGSLDKDGYLKNDFYSSNPTNTSSGTKQIGIIQILLNNEKLKPGTFLIIDEPEVNLHPEWQFKFAEILVLIAKELNVKIYINSHSPLFIEAIDAFTEYYDIEEDINFYLTEQFYDEEGGFYILHDHMDESAYKLTKEFETYHKFNFTKIESNELYRIYDNLGNAYRLIDQLRIRKRLGA